MITEWTGEYWSPKSCLIRYRFDDKPMSLEVCSSIHTLYLDTEGTSKIYPVDFLSAFFFVCSSTAEEKLRLWYNIRVDIKFVIRNQC